MPLTANPKALFLLLGEQHLLLIVDDHDVCRCVWRVMLIMMIMIMMVMMVSNDTMKMSFITTKVLMIMIERLMTPNGQAASSLSLVTAVLCYSGSPTHCCC